MTRTKYQIVVDMVRAGYSRRAIAEQLGTNVYNIYNCIKYARSLGMTVQFDMDRVLLATAPPHIEQWLRAQAPEGATAGDMILAILNDAYSEEMEKSADAEAARLAQFGKIKGETK